MKQRLSTALGLFSVLAFLAMGCGGESDSKKADPIDVTGTLSFADGKAVDGVSISFFVMSRGGSPAVMPVQAGAFKGQLIPGEYSWFLVEGKNPAAWKTIPAAYQENSSDRKLTISPTAKDLKLTVNK